MKNKTNKIKRKGFKFLSLNERIQIEIQYCSPERGSNENLNGLIHRYFPKGTDFSKITGEEIRRVEGLLNNQPRKR